MLFANLQFDVPAEIIDGASAQAAWLSAQVSETSLPAHAAALEHVMKYVSDNGCIVYGGFAWSLLLKSIGVVEKVTVPFVDVDFYSPRPVHDLKALSDLLAALGFKHVNAKNSIHEETYSIFLGAQKVCDISYMPRIVHAKLPVWLVDGIRVINPKIMMIDNMKMLCTPVSAYWRIGRTISRAKELMTHFPLLAATDVCTSSLPSQTAMDALDVLVTCLCNEWKQNSLLWMTVPEPEQDTLENCAAMTMDVVSTKYAQDLDQIKSVLASTGVDFETRAFQPFLGYWGRHTRFIVDGHTVLNVFDAAGKGFHYNEFYDARAQKNHRVATTTLYAYHLLVKELHAYVHQDPFAMGDASAALNDFINRNCSLQLTVSCHGKYTTAHYDFLLRNVYKTQKCDSVIPNYRPKRGQKAKLDADAFHFKNTSGSMKLETRHEDVAQT